MNEGGLLLVSVFVVTYNQEKYIRQCLDSILMQQVDFDYEVVIGEDHGTDGTRAICEEYAVKYPQVRLLPFTKNLGVAGNWKRVLSECRGKYVAMCEGDDYWTDSLKLQKQVDFFRNDTSKEYIMSFHDVSVKYYEGRIIEESKTEGGIACADKTSEELIIGAHPSTQTVFFRADHLPEILSKMKSYHWNNSDAILFSLLGRYGKGKFLPEVGNSVWRIHGNSVWSSAPNIVKEINLFHTFTFLQKANNDYKSLFYTRRVSLSNRILQESIRKRMFCHATKFYFIACGLFIRNSDFKGLWNIQKGVVYNLIHKADE